MDKELKLSLGKLAHDLHMQYSGELSISVDGHLNIQHHGQNDYEGFSISGNTLTFNSLDERHKLTAFYLFETKKEFISSPAEWFDIAHDIWVKEIRNIGQCKAKAAGYLLILIHEQYDIFSLAVAKLQENAGAKDVFYILHLLSAVLPLLQSFSTDFLIELVSIQHESTKNDLASGSFFSDLRLLLVKHPDVCKEIHVRLGETLREEVASLYTTAIISLAETDPVSAYELIIGNLKSSSSTMKEHILWVCGRLLENEILPSEEAVDYMKDQLVLACNSEDKAYRYAAIGIMARTIGKHDDLDRKLTEIAQNEDQHALQEVARFLADNRAISFQSTLVKNYITLLCNLHPSTQSGIQSFDWILGKLIKKPDLSDFSISCISTWISKQSSTNHSKAREEIEQFNNLLNSIAENHSLISTIVTSWLANEDRALNIGADTLLSHLWINRIGNIKFSKEKLDGMNFQELMLLVRHMLGYISQEDQLISLSISILETENAPNRCFGILHNLFIEEIGRDFPSSLVEKLKALKGQINDPIWIGFYDSAISGIENPLEKLRELPVISEIKPPTQLKRQFSLARSKLMDESRSKADEKSVFLNLVSKIPIKAGLGWFKYHDNDYTEPSYMQSHSYSYTLPLRYIHNAVGSEIRRYNFRHAQKEDE